MPPGYPDPLQQLFASESPASPAIALAGAVGFEQISVLTDEGLVVTGFKVSDKGEEVILREPAGGREIRIDSDTIEETFPSQVSAMPAGLVNQLAGRQQFLDVARFLMDVYEGGPERLQHLKAAAQSSAP